MEVKINQVNLPEKITFNYEELKRQVADKLEYYKSVVYTENQVKDAKTDRANLNKLKKALNDERIRQEKAYMQPFNEFKAQINEIISLIDEPVKLIGNQLDGFEEKRKAEKQKEIIELFDGLATPEWLTIEQIFNEKWLNASVNITAIQKEIDDKLSQIDSDFSMLSRLSEYNFEAKEEYKKTLDIQKVFVFIDKLKAMAEIKKEAQPQPPKQETVEQVSTPVDDAPKQWVSFKANLTVEQAKELKQFFNDRNIEFEAIK